MPDADTAAVEPRDAEVKVSVSGATRGELRSLKRGGETYDCLLQKMIDQYDPDGAPEVYL